MRKLTPEERAAKKATPHVHDENCGHDVATDEASDKPSRRRRRAEEAPSDEPVAEAPVAEAPVAEAPTEVAEAPAEVAEPSAE